MKGKFAKPWFSLEKSGDRPPKKVAVIGAGIAGTTIARRLADRGCKVSLFDAGKGPGSGASGNPAGLVQPIISTTDNLMHLASLTGVQELEELLEQKGLTGPAEWHPTGVFHLPTSAKLAEKPESFHPLPPHLGAIASWMGGDQLQQASGLRSDKENLFLKPGGWLSPIKLCRALLETEHINCCFTTEITGIDQNKQRKWKLQSKTDLPEEEYDAVIVANAWQAVQFAPLSWLPLRHVHGQIGVYRQEAFHFTPKTGMSYKGYLIPYEDKILLGASYTRYVGQAQVHKADRRENLEKFMEALPGMVDPNATPCYERAGTRAVTTDRLPLVGPIPQLIPFLQAFAPLAKGKQTGDFPPCPLYQGLFVSLGHGSRGLSFAPLAAKMIEAMIFKEPLNKKLTEAFLPARFLIRAIKRDRLEDVLQQT